VPAPERHDERADDTVLGPLAVLLERPSESAVLTDFDGTLAPIVADADAAVPLSSAPAVLGRLAARFGVVAVVSGRPASFLAERLAGAGSAVRLFGLYGLERVEAGRVVRDPAVEPWLDPVAQVAAAARAQLRDLGVRVEDKGAAVTVHWRQAPEAGPAVATFARAWGQRTGLALQSGRMALEFRPPLGIDKGSVVERLARGLSAACFAGDDAGDLAAFAALDRLAKEGTRGVRVAVADEEVPDALVDAADVVVAGPAAALALFDALAASAR
jgi:trehalose 6-phosphate phosphatase